MTGTFNLVGSVVGIVGGVVAIITAIFSMTQLHRQTLHMESQVDKAIEVKITRDLEAPEGGVDSTLRVYLTKRLGDVRSQLRQELGSRIDELGSRIDRTERALAGSHIDDAVKLWADQREAVDNVRESTGKVYELEQEVRNLHQVVTDIRNGVGDQTMVRSQIRGIAEQLLRMTSLE